MRLTRAQSRFVKANPDAERLLAKAFVGIGDSCWLWNGSRSQDGYGTFYFRKKTWKAHRVSYTIFCGEIPDGLCVCHHCDNPPCINPSHLFLGHASANMKDMVRKGRCKSIITSEQNHFKSGSAPNGEKASGHKLSESDAKAIIERAAIGHLTSEIMSDYKVERSTIQRILRGETWSYLPRPSSLPRPAGRYISGRAALAQSVEKK